MQATREGKATRSAVLVISALAIATWLGAGCGKAEKTEPPEPPAPEATEVPNPVEDEEWEPITVTPSNDHSDHGHDDHDHGPGGHTH